MSEAAADTAANVEYPTIRCVVASVSRVEGSLDALVAIPKIGIAIMPVR